MVQCVSGLGGAAYKEILLRWCAIHIDQRDDYQRTHKQQNSVCFIDDIQFPVFWFLGEYSF